jgi:hypothetical protein
MQSKQGKRGKALKQVGKTRSPKRAAKRTPFKRMPRAGLATNRTEIVRAPIAVGFQRRGFHGLRFGAAAPHDEFPEGGLRIYGTLPGGSGTQYLNGDYSGSGTGLWAFTGVCWAVVTPTGALMTGTVPVFDSAGPLAQFSEYFRRFRFRSLSCEYNGMIATSSSENRVLQISYESDPARADAAQTSLTQLQAVNQTSKRFTSWETEVMIPLIRERKTSPSDELWYVAPAADVITTGDPSNQRFSCQGVVSAVGSTLPTAAETTYGTVLWHFTVDLYGFSNLQSIPVPARKPSVKEEKHLRVSASAPPDKGDSKVEHDFVELTPKSRRVSETPPPSVRVSSRKN